MLPALANACRVLGTSWTVHLLHLDDNDVLEQLRSNPRYRLLASELEVGRLQFRHLREVDADAAVRAHGFRYRAGWFAPRLWYNEMLVRNRFWQAFSQPWLLLFEVDSVLCPSPTLPLTAFLQADFMFYGAPWDASQPACRARVRGTVSSLPCVGNSGLSLWNRRQMLELLRQFSPHGVRRRHGVVAPPPGDATRVLGARHRALRKVPQRGGQLPLVEHQGL